jgi:3-dehydrosphinganine reductase
MRYRNKTIYITGGSSGLGLGLAREFLQQGGSVVLLARKEGVLAEAVAKLQVYLQTDSQTIDSCVADVSDRVGFGNTIAHAVDKFGKPDVLIHSAGTLVTKLFTEISDEEFDHVMNTNMGGTYNVVSRFLPYMESGGAIMLISSLAGLMGVYGYTGYCASKHAMVGFAGALRSELRDKNISVSLFCPPEVKTPLLDLERDSIPSKTRFIKDMVGTLDVEPVCAYTMKQFNRQKFMIIPGVRARLTCFLVRLFPDIMRTSTEFLADRFCSSPDKTKA